MSNNTSSVARNQVQARQDSNIARVNDAQDEQDFSSYGDPSSQVLPTSNMYRRLTSRQARHTVSRGADNGRVLDKRRKREEESDMDDVYEDTREYAREDILEEMQSDENDSMGRWNTIPMDATQSTQATMVQSNRGQPLNTRQLVKNGATGRNNPVPAKKKRRTSWKMLEKQRLKREADQARQTGNEPGIMHQQKINQLALLRQQGVGQFQRFMQHQSYMSFAHQQQSVLPSFPGFSSVIPSGASLPGSAITPRPTISSCNSMPDHPPRPPPQSFAWTSTGRTPSGHELSKSSIRPCYISPYPPASPRNPAIQPAQPVLPTSTEPNARRGLTDQVLSAQPPQVQVSHPHAPSQGPTRQPATVQPPVSQGLATQESSVQRYATDTRLAIGAAVRRELQLRNPARKIPAIPPGKSDASNKTNTNATPESPSPGNPSTRSRTISGSAVFDSNNSSISYSRAGSHSILSSSDRCSPISSPQRVVPLSNSAHDTIIWARLNQVLNSWNEEENSGTSYPPRIARKVMEVLDAYDQRNPGGKARLISRIAKETAEDQ